jgi:hypothetical protein
MRAWKIELVAGGNWAWVACTWLSAAVTLMRRTAHRRTWRRRPFIVPVTCDAPAPVAPMPPPIRLACSTEASRGVVVSGRSAARKAEMTPLDDVRSEDAAIAEVTAVVEAGGVVLVGETHGVAENAAVLDWLVRRLGPAQVALEWPAAAGAALWEHAHGRVIDVGALRPSSDGRITPHHFEVVRRLVQRCFVSGIAAFVPEHVQLPDDDRSQNVWEGAMARRLLELREAGCPTVAMVGSVHALLDPQPVRGPNATDVGRMFAGDPTFRDRDAFYPMGWHVAGAVSSVCILIRYGAGSFTNFGVRRFPRERAVKQEGLRHREGKLVFDVVRATAAPCPDDRFWPDVLG